VEFSPLVGDIPQSLARSKRCVPAADKISNEFRHREARSKSNSGVTKKKTSFELVPRDHEFASHKPDLLS
jgi:hypothetical protein